MAERIQARAIRRCGELLEQVKKGNGKNQNIRDAAVPNVTRKTAETGRSVGASAQNGAARGERARA